MDGIVAPEIALPAGTPAGERVPMGPQAIREYAAKMARRYRRAERAVRGQLLDEFVAVTGMNRKYAIGLLGGRLRRPTKRRGRPSRYGPEVVAALVALWRAMDYPWSQRLRTLLPLWLPRARTLLSLEAATESLLRAMSARTMDRYLRPHRSTLRRRMYGRTKPGTLLKHQVPIRSERWDVSEAGWCEVDTVAHCGGSGDGEFVSSVNATDVASTWTETRAVLGKGQRHVVAALEEIRLAMPFALRGLDSDSGSEFINRQCIRWCLEKDLKFTRSRPYHKNDNAHVEQKNWTHVRKVLGWQRFDSHEHVRAMNDLYANEIRLLMNYFQTSVKLVEKRRVGSRIVRRYEAAMTPLDRLIALKLIDEAAAARLIEHRNRIDPFALAAAIERKVAAIRALPVGPVQKRPRNRCELDRLSKKSAAGEAAFRAAPVRSFMAR
ncbi:MAG: integrase [Vulcanimicrobiaceae bacterium]